MSTMAPPFVLRRADVHEMDRAASDEFAMPGLLLMENAGRNAAHCLLNHEPTIRRAVVICGPGNNGGDGYVIARHLEIHGVAVEVVLVTADRSAAVSADSAVNRTIWRKGGGVEHAVHGAETAAIPEILRSTSPSSCDWVIDALFGIGLSRIPQPPFSSAIEAMNASGRPIFAVDVPSGLDADTGRPLGSAVVSARRTVTFVAPKVGFAAESARPYLGWVDVVDIGAPRLLIDRYRLRCAGGR